MKQIIILCSLITFLTCQTTQGIDTCLMTNYHGPSLYEVARKLYEALPDFLCGNNGGPAENSISSFPDPFFMSTTLAFKLQKTGSVSLKVYDISGKLITEVYNGKAQSKITGTLSLDGTKPEPGVYTARLQTGSRIVEKKIIKSR